MITVTTRHIMHRLFIVFLILLGGLTGLYAVVDFFERIDNFIERGTDTGEVLRYFLYRLPEVLTQLIPAASLFASVLVLGTMHKHRELVALRAAGIGPLVFIKPIVIVALSLTAAHWVLGETLARPLGHRAEQIWQKKIERRAKMARWTPQHIWYHGDRIVYRIGFYRSETGVLQQASLYYRGDDYRLEKQIDAERIVWRSNHWEALDGKVTTFSNGVPQTSSFNKRNLPITETPRDFDAAIAEPRNLSWMALYRYTKNLLEKGFQPTEYQVQLHSRTAAPFSVLVFMLIGAAIPLVKTSDRGLAADAGKALLVALIHAAIFQTGHSFASSGVIPPSVGVWAANLTMVAWAFGIWRKLF